MKLSFRKSKTQTIIDEDMLIDGDWSVVKKAIKHSSGATLNAAFSDDLKRQHSTVLHAVVAHYPPIDVVERIVKLQPKSIYAEDNDSRLPVHVAILNKADHEVVNFLLDQSSCGPDGMKCSAAFHQDKNGESPLHLACKWSPGFYDIDQDEVIGHIISIAPGSLLLEDIDSLTPLEVAFETDCCNAIVFKLHQKSNIVRLYEQKRTCNGGTPRRSSSVAEIA